VSAPARISERERANDYNGAACAYSLILQGYRTRCRSRHRLFCGRQVL